MIKNSSILLAFVAMPFVCGAFSEYLFPRPTESPVDFVLIVAGIGLIFAWYHADAMQRSYKRTALLNIAIVVFAGLAMPYYFFRTRGFKGGLLATALLYLCAIGFGIMDGLGGFLVHVARS